MYIFSCQKNQSQLVGEKKKHSSMGPKANQQLLMYRKLWVWFSLVHGVIYLWWYLYLCTLNLTERITYSAFTLKFYQHPQKGTSSRKFTWIFFAAFVGLHWLWFHSTTDCQACCKLGWQETKNQLAWWWTIFRSQCNPSFDRYLL